MASLKQLAGQTVWYGLSNIVAKFLNQLLTPIITYILNNPAGMVDYGNMTMIYSGISLLNIIYTYGLETAYFRFSASGEDKKRLFQTTFSSLLISSLVLSVIIFVFRQPLAEFIGIDNHPEYITWCVLIIAIDTLSAIPFAMLRQEGRPRKYAFVRVSGIIVNIVLTVFFIAWSPRLVAEQPNGGYAQWYSQYTATGFLLLANLGQAMVTFLLLFGEWRTYRPQLDSALWKKVTAYSWPMLIVGMGGMVNETLDRIMLPKLLPVGDELAKQELAIYSANYKIAIFITLFVQAFKMSAEPFFFGQATQKNAPGTYARVMKWFVITLCIAFLFTALYLDLWKYFIGPAYRQGLGVVPILLAANIALGIYYNLSVWYKITDRMHWGTYITLVGAAITIVCNVVFIPAYGMYACAWTTLAAYAAMMALSYFAGQRYFPVPYAVGKLATYIVLMLGLYFVQRVIGVYTEATAIRLVSGTVLMLTFVAAVVRMERQELAGMPVIGKFLRRTA